MNKPKTIDPLAEQVLDRLTGKPEAREIILGGYFALQHYLDYRRTHDIDAWWRQRSSPATEQAIREAMRNVADPNGLELRERRFGETVSFELFKQARKQFSFQIAVRSVSLEGPVPSAWPPILIETLADNVGSKMNALVERGSSRDFMDIKHVVDAGLIGPLECWQLWLRKNAGQALDAGRQKVLLHLSALESRRPLDTIKEPAERERARVTRQWFRQAFLKE